MAAADATQGGNGDAQDEDAVYLICGEMHDKRKLKWLSSASVVLCPPEHKDLVLRVPSQHAIFSMLPNPPLTRSLWDTLAESKVEHALPEWTRWVTGIALDRPPAEPVSVDQPVHKPSALAQLLTDDSTTVEQLKDALPFGPAEVSSSAVRASDLEVAIASPMSRVNNQSSDERIHKNPADWKKLWAELGDMEWSLHDNLKALLDCFDPFVDVGKWLCCHGVPPIKEDHEERKGTPGGDDEVPRPTEQQRESFKQRGRNGPAPLSLLHKACWAGNKELVQFIVDKCAERKQWQWLNHTDNERWTALHVAVHVGNHEIAATLLKKGRADPLCADMCSWTALDLAAALGQRNTVKAMLQHSRVDHWAGNQALKFAKLAQHHSVAAKLRWKLPLKLTQHIAPVLRCFADNDKSVRDAGSEVLRWLQGIVGEEAVDAQVDRLRSGLQRAVRDSLKSLAESKRPPDQPVDCAKDKAGVTALVPRQSPPRMSPAVKPESKAKIEALMQKCMRNIAPEDEAKRINQIDQFYALCTVQYSVNTSLSPTPPAATTSNSSTFSFSSYGQPGVRFLPSTISQLIKVLTEQLRFAYLDQHRMSKLAARSLQLLGEVLRSRKCTKRTCSVMGTRLSANGFRSVLGSCSVLEHKQLLPDSDEVLSPQVPRTLKQHIEEVAEREKFFMELIPLDNEQATLVGGLVESANLTVLSLRFTQLGDEGSSRLAEAFPQANETVHTLVLAHNDISDAGVACLTAKLKGFKALRRLDLSHNCIGLEGTKNLAELLEKLPDLQVLDLSCNESVVGCKCRQDQELHGDPKCCAQHLQRTLHARHKNLYDTPQSTDDEDDVVTHSAFRVDLSGCHVGCIPASFLSNIVPYSVLAKPDQKVEDDQDDPSQSMKAQTVSACVLGFSRHGKSTFIRTVLMDKEQPSDLANWELENVVYWANNVGVEDVVVNALKELKVKGTDIVGKKSFELLCEKLTEMPIQQHLVKRLKVSRARLLLETMNPKVKDWTKPTVFEWGQWFDLPTKLALELASIPSPGQALLQRPLPREPNNNNYLPLFSEEQQKRDRKSLGQAMAAVRDLRKFAEQATQLEDAGLYPSTKGVDMNVIGTTQVLDFAGQKEFYAGHEHIIPRAGVVNVVVGRMKLDSNGAVSIDDALSSLEYWMDLLSTQMMQRPLKVPLLVIVTHIDCLLSLPPTTRAAMEQRFRSQLARCVAQYLGPTSPFQLWRGDSEPGLVHANPDGTYDQADLENAIVFLRYRAAFPNLSPAQHERVRKCVFAAADKEKKQTVLPFVFHKALELARASLENTPTANTLSLGRLLKASELMDKLRARLKLQGDRTNTDALMWQVLEVLADFGAISCSRHMIKGREAGRVVMLSKFTWLGKILRHLADPAFFANYRDAVDQVLSVEEEAGSSSLPPDMENVEVKQDDLLSNDAFLSGRVLEQHNDVYEDFRCGPEELFMILDHLCSVDLMVHHPHTDKETDDPRGYWLLSRLPESVVSVKWKIVPENIMARRCVVFPTRTARLPPSFVPALLCDMFDTWKGSVELVEFDAVQLQILFKKTKNPKVPSALLVAANRSAGTIDFIMQDADKGRRRRRLDRHYAKLLRVLQKFHSVRSYHYALCARSLGDLPTGTTQVASHRYWMPNTARPGLPKEAWAPYKKLVHNDPSWRLRVSRLKVFDTQKKAERLQVMLQHEYDEEYVCKTHKNRVSEQQRTRAIVVTGKGQRPPTPDAPN